MSWEMSALYFVLFISVIVQVAFLLFYIYVGFKLIGEQKQIQVHPSVSLIICAKNEYQNLLHNLPVLLQLDYPKEKLELIIVNDVSTDDTAVLLERFKKDNPQLIHIVVNDKEARNLPGKKYALERGIAAANHEWILLTDADCIPRDTKWIQMMVSAAEKEQANIVLGYGAYEQGSSLLNRFIQFETLHTAMQYFSYAQAGAAYMGVGRNLMYKSGLIKEAFNDPDLIRKMQQTASGDDDLIISHYPGEKKACICNKASQTVSVAPADWKTYFRQKSRHTSSSKYYSSSTKVFLALYAFSHFAFWCTALWMLMAATGSRYYWLLLSAAMIVLLLKYLSYSLWKKKLASSVPVITFIIMDFFWCIYNVILSPYIFWKNKMQWK